jgi:hypothetical protein
MTNPVQVPRRPRPTAGELLHEIRCLITDLLRFATAPLYRRRHLRWGATDDEIRASMPGDEVITKPMYLATRAITINAPPSAVWPWLVQVGCLRAGFYAHECGLAQWSVVAHVAEHEGPMAVAPVRDHGGRSVCGRRRGRASCLGDPSRRRYRDGRATLSL